MADIPSLDGSNCGCSYSGTGPYGVGVVSAPCGGGIIKTIIAPQSPCCSSASGSGYNCYPSNPIYPPAATTFPPDSN